MLIFIEFKLTLLMREIYYTLVFNFVTVYILCETFVECENLRTLRLHRSLRLFLLT
jgi:hypothetical protein